MAFYTETNDNQSKASFAARIWHGLERFFAMLADAQDRTEVAERMQGLSDDDLAKIGVRREDIVRHVYRDNFYV